MKIIMPLLPVALAVFALAASAGPEPFAKIEMSPEHQATCAREGGCQVLTLEAIKTIQAAAFAAGRRHEASLQTQAKATCGRYSL